MSAALELDYRVRVSRRARYLRLVVSDDGELTVVLPVGVGAERAARAVEANRAWLERAIRRIDADLRPGPAERPSALDLAAVGEHWSVDYAPGPRRRVVASVDRLVVESPADRDDDARVALDRWLRRRALASFEPRVRELAARRGVSVAKVAVRTPRTRWASCSAAGSIMLNAQLLFVPSVLADHVIWHELCHRIELSHAPRFWRLLEECSPGARERDAELRRAKALVPRWLRA